MRGELWLLVLLLLVFARGFQHELLSPCQLLSGKGGELEGLRFDFLARPGLCPGRGKPPLCLHLDLFFRWLLENGHVRSVDPELVAIVIDSMQIKGCPHPRHGYRVDAPEDLLKRPSAAPEQVVGNQQRNAVALGIMLLKTYVRGRMKMLSLNL